MRVETFVIKKSYCSILLGFLPSCKIWPPLSKVIMCLFFRKRYIKVIQKIDHDWCHFSSAPESLSLLLFWLTKYNVDPSNSRQTFWYLFYLTIVLVFYDFFAKIGTANCYWNKAGSFHLLINHVDFLYYSTTSRSQLFFVFVLIYS